MTKLAWDQVGEKFYETGVDHGVLYLPDEQGVFDQGVVWNGLTAVTESPSGAEATPMYADNQKYLNLVSAEEYAATIEAFTYPDEFAICEGSATPKPGILIGQQGRAVFGFAYRTKIANDLNANLGYKIHLVYNALAAPTEKAHATVNDTPEAITFSWEVTTTPVEVPGFDPSATVVLDSTQLSAGHMKALEDILYGTEADEPRLPRPSEIISIVDAPAPAIV